jgi:AAA domain
LAEEQVGLRLADSQVAAIRLALMSKVLVMTGGPGVGKTTIVKAILRILAAKGVRLLLCAPTGRAAKLMTEATGFEAKTIHRLLEVDPKAGGFKRNDENPIDCDLRVIDEASMVDVLLMQALLKALPDNAALLIVGDINSFRRWTWSGVGGHHRVRCRASEPAHRSVPPSCPEPHHHEPIASIRDLSRILIPPPRRWISISYQPTTRRRRLPAWSNL